jgi:hypothetical protein
MAARAYPEGMAEETGAHPSQPRQPRAGRSRTPDLPMYKIAYEEGKRLVDDQLAELDGMRQRSVQFLAFVGSATAFLVGTSLGRVGTSPGLAYGIVALVLAIVASLAAAVAIVLVVFILLALSKKGRIKFEFRLSPAVLVEMIDPEVPQKEEAAFMRRLALDYGEMHDTNETSIIKLRKCYTAFIALGFSQLVLWAIVAWING